MVTWNILQFSKDDPDTIIICRNHYSGAPPLVLSVDEQRTSITSANEAARRTNRHNDQPIEIQITNGNGQTAIVFIHGNPVDGTIIIHGHIEGRRHRYGWRSIPENKSTQKMKRVTLALKFHVTADGMIELTPMGQGLFKYAFVTMDGTDLKFEKLELVIPMFLGPVRPPAYQPATA